MRWQKKAEYHHFHEKKNQEVHAEVIFHSTTKNYLLTNLSIPLLFYILRRFYSNERAITGTNKIYNILMLRAEEEKHIIVKADGKQKSPHPWSYFCGETVSVRYPTLGNS